MDFQNSNLNFSPSQFNSPEKETSVSLLCDKHPTEQITNFCCAIDCLKALCPECIDTHNRLHRQNHIFPEIDSVKNVKKNCTRKVKAGITILTQELEKLELKQFLSPQDILDEGIVTIRNSKDKLLQIIDNFFNSLEVEYKTSMSHLAFQGKDMNTVFEKVRNFINELEFMVASLDSANALNTIKKVCKTDLKTSIDKYKNDINSISSQETLKKAEIIINDTRLRFLEMELKKYIRISSLNEDEKILNLSKTSNSDYKNSPSQKERIPEFKINIPDYFDSRTKKKYLHFFPNGQKLLYLLNLEKISSSSSFEIIEMDIDFSVPRFHKSLITPDGTIFLLGGTAIDSNRKNEDVFFYDYNKNTLKPFSKMLLPRSSFSVCFSNREKAIFVVGGLGNNNEFTKLCEKIDVRTGKCFTIGKLNEACGMAAVCEFGDNYIFKFGGLGENMGLCNNVERYSFEKDAWEKVDAKIDNHDPYRINLKEFNLLSTCAAVQINENEIMIFGGYKATNEASAQSFIFSGEADERNYIDYEIKWINYKALKSEEGFWNSQVIPFGKRFYALQNINDEKNENCLENHRRILVFNSNEWRSLN